VGPRLAKWKTGHKLYSEVKKSFLELNIIIISLISLSFLWLPSKGISCTLFGAIGDGVEGGGVLIGKTRDRPRSLEQAFTEVLPKSGYGYRGISLKGLRNVTSGMNEKRLVVVSAAASNVEREDNS